MTTLCGLRSTSTNPFECTKSTARQSLSRTYLPSARRGGVGARWWEGACEGSVHPHLRSTCVSWPPDSISERELVPPSRTIVGKPCSSSKASRNDTMYSDCNARSNFTSRVK